MAVQGGTRIDCGGELEGIPSQQANEVLRLPTPQYRTTAGVVKWLSRSRIPPDARINACGTRDLREPRILLPVSA